VTPVVIDASAGLELAADTVRGRALRALLRADAVPWVPELFYVECGAVLRRWDLNGILTPTQISQAIGEPMAWLLFITQVRGLFADAWQLRANVTFADAVYVALADHLDADLLCEDIRLANAPGLPVRVLHLPYRLQGPTTGQLRRRRRRRCRWRADPTTPARGRSASSSAGPRGWLPLARLGAGRWRRGRP
jgi:predicted nucleic acid-binding protein